MIFNCFSIFLGFIFFFYLFHKFPKLDTELNDCDKTLADQSISIIIPARNEELNLPNILHDLKNQNYNIHEIICIDDDSTDATAEIIKNSDAKYLNINTLPDGWKGKTWACQNGAKKATGDLLLFIDADVRFSTNAIRSLINQYDKNGNPISIQPFHTVEKKHEYFSLFFNLIQICATSLSVYKAKKHIGFYGPVLLISRKLFLDNGGYEAVKNSVIEDFNLGKYYNKKNIKIDLILGGKQISFKMYPNSFSEVFEGWSKNFSSGSISISLKLFIFIFFWIVYLTVLPFIIVQSFLLKYYILFALTIIIYLLTVIKLNNSAKNIGSYPIVVSIIYPIYLVIFHLIFFYSLLGTYVFKTTKWKGRKLKRK
jgi:4,4'-diaponeurosporenoate glycosyltransferase